MLHKTNYVVRVDACPLWANYDSVTLAMCMGNDNWDGEKFLTVLEWATRHFKTIRVALSDSLGRHNLMMTGMPPAEAEAQACNEGDYWLNRHGTDILSCGKGVSVVRWDYWRQHSDFQQTLNVLSTLAQANKRLSEALAEDVRTYEQRYLRRGLLIGENFEKHCRDYLLEELAGTTLRARAMPNSCRVYPAAEPKSSQLIRAGLINDAPLGLGQEYYVAINLRRRKDTASQKVQHEGLLAA